MAPLRPIALLTAVFAAFLPGGVVSAGPPPPTTLNQQMIADCDEAALGHGDGRPPIGSTSAGPFGLIGPARDFRDAFLVKHRTGLGAKIPAFVIGERSVTVTVRPRYQDQVGLDFGNLHTAPNIRRANTVVRFEPCNGRPETAWPGGLFLRDRRPVEFTVRVEGRERVRVLRVGRP